jgi:hypothetical protein
MLSHSTGFINILKNYLKQMPDFQFSPDNHVALFPNAANQTEAKQ